MPPPSDSRLLVRTGWEAKHPLPVWFDLAKREPARLAEMQKRLDEIAATDNDAKVVKGS